MDTVTYMAGWHFSGAEDDTYIRYGPRRSVPSMTPRDEWDDGHDTKPPIIPIAPILRGVGKRRLIVRDPQMEVALGEALKGLRRVCGWKQIKLAKAIGVNYNTLSRLEHADYPNTIPLSLLHKIARCVQVPRAETVEEQVAAFTAALTHSPSGAGGGSDRTPGAPKTRKGRSPGRGEPAPHVRSRPAAPRE